MGILNKHTFVTLPVSHVSPGVPGGYLHTKAVNGFQESVGAQTSRLGIVSLLVTC